MRLPLACVVLGAFVAVASAPADGATRFVGQVAGVGSGPGHRFVVGDGLYIVFRDLRAAGTAYRVCWGPRGKRVTRCWNRTTGRRGSTSRIFTPAPNYVGNWSTTWYVAGRVAARWTFFNGYGD